MAANISMGRLFVCKTKNHRKMVLYESVGFQKVKWMSSEKAISSLPKICTVLQELEGFTFATALDLNIGYYNIRLDTDASRICTIIGDGTSTPIRDYRGVCRFSRHISSKNVHNLKRTSCHCWNTQRIQRYVVGPKHCSLYRPQKSHTGHFRIGTQLSVALETGARGIRSWDHLH